MYSCILRLVPEGEHWNSTVEKQNPYEIQKPGTAAKQEKQNISPPASPAAQPKEERRGFPLQG
jgi:hypothetical protein